MSRNEYFKTRRNKKILDMFILKEENKNLKLRETNYQNQLYLLHQQLQQLQVENSQLKQTSQQYLIMNTNMQQTIQFQQSEIQKRDANITHLTNKNALLVTNHFQASQLLNATSDVYLNQQP